jgi:two-component system OmpR family response regulator
LDNRKKILLIEDNFEIRTLISAFLSAEVYDVTEAESVAVAIQKLSIGMSFDLAIIDFWLGKSHAVSIMDKIASDGKTVPFILITGGNGIMDMEVTEAIADISGATVFLQKPFQRSTLLAAVATALKGSLSH